jgi:threonine dehydrogenase-like Zn-dependent dehydrogenase
MCAPCHAPQMIIAKESRHLQFVMTKTCARNAESMRTVVIFGFATMGLAVPKLATIFKPSRLVLTHPDVDFLCL